MPPGRRLALRYVLRSSAGVGGFGEVFRARDEVARRDVAVKIFFPGRFDLERARDEFRLAAALRHPNVAAPLDLGVDAATGRAFMVSEWAGGRDLDREPRLRSDPAALARVAAELLRTLDAVHRHGFVHLDVKPANVRVALDPAPARATLLDFGLARRSEAMPSDPAARPVGSPPYAAPEVASGAPVDGRADLYGLGMTLLRVLAGSPGGFERRLASGSPAAAAEGLPEPFASFLPALLEKDPAARPAGAAAALDALRAVAPDAFDGETAPSAAPFAGREAALARLLEAVASARSGAAAPVVTLVLGEPGSGRTRLLDEARVRLQTDDALRPTRPVAVSSADASGTPGAFLGALVRGLRALAAEAPGAGKGPGDPASAPLLAVAGLAGHRDAAPGDARETPVELAAALARLLDAAASSAPLALLLDEPDRADALSRDVVRAFLRFAFAEPGVGSDSEEKRAGAAVIVAASPEFLDFADAPPRLRRRAVGLEPLSREAIAAIAAFEMPAADPAVVARLAAEVERKSGGHAGLAVETLRHLAAAAAGDPETLASLSLETTSVPSSFRALLEKRVAAVSPAARDLLADLALLATVAPAPLRRALGHAAPAEAEARRAGFVRDDGEGGLSIRSGALADAAFAGIGAARAVSRHAAIARALEEMGGDTIAAARHALRGGLPSAPRLALAAAHAMAARRAPSDAARLLSEAIPLAGLEGEELRARRVDQGQWHLRAGETADAAAAFEAALEAAPDGDARASVGLAEALRRRGDAAAAIRVLAAAAPVPEALAAVASIEIERGAPLAAVAAIRRALDAGRESLAAATHARLRNLLGIASVRLGRTDGAESEFEAARELAAAAGDDETVASTLTNSGVLHYQNARLDLAEKRHREALALARRTAHVAREAAALNNLALVLRDRGALAAAADALLEAFRLRERISDAHGAASSLANLAAVERERGRLARAVALGERALERLSMPLDAPRERALAGFHLALARLATGDAESAEETARAAAETAATRGFPAEAAAARVLVFRARAARGLSPDPEVAAALADAAALETANAPRSLRAETDAGLAEALLAAALGRDAAAEELALRAEAAARGAMEDAALRARFVALAARRPAEAERRTLLRSLARAAASSERPELVFRIFSALADAERAGSRRAEAERAARRAREALRSIEDALPRKTLELFRSAPQRAREIALLAAVENDLRPTALGARHAPLDVVRRFLAINRRLLEAESEGSLLEGILDGAIALSGAERGLVITADGESLSVRLARPAPRGGTAAAPEGVSRGIVLRALRSARPVVVKDAASDPRFRERASVAERRLMSVAALPLAAAREKPFGALYLDNRSVANLFTDEAVEILQGFADQAALALRAFRHRADAVARSERLESEIEAKTEEIARAKERLAVHGDESFHGIRGRSAAMKAVFALARRAAATSLPVLLAGESGTGKEALARAIHLESPRASGPFVTVDCGTLPENVIESELFGHVKGAFTSALADTKGLFRSAERGTLFLDGVDELSLAAQAKLLRALETGEVRPVGAESPVRADVRLVATTRADLAERIAAGAFRADLFYRLEGVKIALPPLRERVEDVPLLADEALRDAAAERRSSPGAPRLAPEALRALLDYPWPGNVRELLNEIRRAALLADGDTIGRADLTRRVAFHGKGGSDRPDAKASLRGRGDFDAALRKSERDLLESVLRSVEGNQSEAARRLGLSRFGLRKKMMRCGLLKSPDGGPAKRG